MNGRLEVFYSGKRAGPTRSLLEELRFNTVLPRWVEDGFWLESWPCIKDFPQSLCLHTLDCLLHALVRLSPSHRCVQVSWAHTHTLWVILIAPLLASLCFSGHHSGDWQRCHFLPWICMHIYKRSMILAASVTYRPRLLDINIWQHNIFRCFLKDMMWL